MAIVKNVDDNEELYVKGIRSLGYGQMPKIVMLDPDLSLEAKAIYAYFCSYTGNGNNTAFPGRNRIMHDLDISNNPYYRYLSQLTDNGYITIKQKAGNPGHPGFKHNIYTLENYPAKFDTVSLSGISDHMAKAYAQIRNVKDISAAGYGTIPRAVMTSNIPIVAKGIYAYFCVFSGTDYESAPDRETILYHLNISHNSFNKYIRILVEANFISKVQSTTNGKFGTVVYHLNQNEQDKISESVKQRTDAPQPKISYTQKSCTQFSETQTSEAQTSCTQFSETQNSETQTSCTQNADIIKPSVNKTKINKTSSYQSINPNTDNRNDGLIDRDENEILKELTETKHIPEDICNNINALTLLIRNLTDWNDRTEDGFYENEVSARVYRMFVDCLAEMMSDNAETYVQGAHITGAQVRSALENSYLEFATGMTGEEYASLGSLPDKVCSNFLSAAEKRKITNQRAYLKAIIWTTLHSIESLS